MPYIQNLVLYTKNIVQPIVNLVGLSKITGLKN